MRPVRAEWTIQTPLFAVYLWSEHNERGDKKISLEVKYGGALFLMLVFALGVVVGKGGI